MNNRAYALLTGVFVLLLASAAIIIGIWMSGSHLKTRPYIVVTTGNVGGLHGQSTVYFRGITAGTVDKISIDPADTRNILIYVNIDQAIPITRATYATLRLQGITGLSQLALDNTPGPLINEPLTTSQESPARIPMRPSLFERLGSSGTDLAAQLDRLAAMLNGLLNTSNREHIKRLLAQADAATAMLLKLETDMDTTAHRLPALDSRMQQTLAKVERAADDVSALSHSLDRQAGTSGLQLNAALVQIKQAAADMQRLANSLRHDPQQLLLGPKRPAPGPGESGYKEPQK